MIKKTTLFLLGTLCALSPAAFASAHEQGRFDELQAVELQNLYPTLVANHPEQLLQVDFALLRVLKTQYKGLSLEEARAKDLTHNEALMPLVSSWKDLFASHGSDQGTFFAQEIEGRMSTRQVSLDWISLLPLRFAAAISTAPCEDELDLYSAQTYENGLRHEDLFQKASWSSHETFYGLITQESHFKNAPLFRPAKNTPHQLVATTILPILGKDELDIPDLVLMNLDHLFPIATPFDPHTHGVHGTKRLSSLGFLLHDILHAQHSHLENQLLESAEQFQECFVSASREKHALLVNTLKFCLLETLKEKEMRFEDPLVRRAFLSIFLGSHEESAWILPFYCAPTLEESIDIFAASITADFERFGISKLETRLGEDVPGTSPFDGAMYLNKDAFWDRLKQYYLEKSPYMAELFKNSPEHFSYTATPDSIIYQVKVEAPGHETNDKSSMQTLHFRLKNARGTLSMLAYAGVTNIEPVTVESLAAGRKIEDLSAQDVKEASHQAITYLQTLATQVSEVVESFRVQARKLLARPEAAPLHTQNKRLEQDMAAITNLFRVIETPPEMQ